LGLEINISTYNLRFNGGSIAEIWIGVGGGSHSDDADGYNAKDRKCGKQAETSKGTYAAYSHSQRRQQQRDNHKAEPKTNVWVTD